jgi:hypothetical protein
LSCGVREVETKQRVGAVARRVGLPSEEVFEAQVVPSSPETRVQARMQSL